MICIILNLYNLFYILSLKYLFQYFLYFCLYVGDINLVIYTYSSPCTTQVCKRPFGRQKPEILSL